MTYSDFPRLGWLGNRHATVEHGGSASAPADILREGYTFNGWDEEFTNVTKRLDYHRHLHLLLLAS